jgi:putative ABC transport system permease protein
VSRTLWRSSVRHAARHPWQAGLAVLGIALGVAVVVSIDLANESARRAFALSTEAVAGGATYQLIGGPSGVPEEIYRRLRVDLGIRAAAPVVEGYASAPALGSGTFRLLGVDPLAGGALSWGPATRDDPTANGLAALLTQSRTAILPAETARERGLAAGSVLEVRIGGTRHALTIVGMIDPEDEVSRQAIDDLLVTDVSTAQELLGLSGRLSRIDLRLPDAPETAVVLDRIRAALPGGVALERAATRAQATEQLARAFSVNLTALSLLALAVGMFLIHNTMTFSVVQQRTSIGLLRALGVTRGEVLGLVLTEALLIGVAGTTLGIPLGMLLAGGLLRLVTRTINDLYFVLTVREVAWAPLALIKGGALGMGVTLLASLGPALEATRSPARGALSRSTLETRIRGAVPHSAWIGLLVLLVAAGLLAAPGAGLIVSYAAVCLLLAGVALLTPALTVAAMRAVEPVAGRLFGVVGRMAARGVVQALSRTGVAVAALTIAVAATVGIGVMVTSFRQTVRAWLESTLQADVYVSAPSLPSGGPESSLDPALVARLARLAGVASVSTHRGVTLESGGDRIRVVALGITSPAHLTFRFTEGDTGAVWRAFQHGAVLVSEPYAYRHGTRPGSTIRLPTDRGDRELPVAAVFYDYATDRGVLVLSRATYERYWNDRGVSALAFRALPGTPVAALTETLRKAIGPGPNVLVRSNRALRDASLEVFDRTFAITTVLRFLAMLVAGVGTLSALMALQLERVREVAILRAQGLTPARVWGLATVQTGLIGLVAGVLAIPAGLALAAVLVFVINRRAFGWSLELHVAPGVAAQAVLLAVAAAILAGIVPALKMARGAPAIALREE